MNHNCLLDEFSITYKMLEVSLKILKSLVTVLFHFKLETKIGLMICVKLLSLPRVKVVSRQIQKENINGWTQ